MTDTEFLTVVRPLPRPRGRAVKCFLGRPRGFPRNLGPEFIATSSGGMSTLLGFLLPRKCLFGKDCCELEPFSVFFDRFGET